MEFCGRCGHRLGRGLERGRFCSRCGHETPGNARYPLYADGTPAVTRPRPASVPQLPAATAVARAVPVAAVPAAAPVPAVATHRPAFPAAATPADVTRRRLRSVLDTLPAAPPVPATGWRVVLATGLSTMAIVVLLGLFLLTR
jgi:hypothetical protein